jgi:hypothetical protein
VLLAYALAQNFWACSPHSTPTRLNAVLATPCEVCSQGLPSDRYFSVFLVFSHYRYESNVPAEIKNNSDAS